MVFGLMDKTNQWQEDPTIVKNIAINYYQNLFSASHSSVQDELLDAIGARVSELMNALLTREFLATEDKWTNNPTTFHISSPQRILPVETMVSALIDAKSGAWKTNMIRDVFIDHEADSILSIPLSTTLPADKPVWTATANGKFGVKSAYHLARSRDRNDGGESSDPSGMHQFWQRLWKARIPSKVRNFG
nr:hypothetical protein CFP56_58251 [Quercus suber]